MHAMRCSKRTWLAWLFSAASSLAGCAGAPQITDAEVRQQYDRILAIAPSREEYRVRHILLETREQAQAALARIESGESFGNVARDVSTDPGSRAAGGELGWSLPEYFVDEFAQAMVGLKPRGLTAAPVQTQFGWHVIEVTDVQLGKATFPPYEQVKDRIAERMRQRARSQ